MEAALRILHDNPLSDEAVFAALFMVAKHAKQAEFAPRRRELLEAMGGINFFRRLLTTKGMEPIALNVLSTFCDDGECARVIRSSCSTELLSACEAIDLHDNNAVHDACQCLVALKDLSGTAGYLLGTLLSGELSEASILSLLNAFEATSDAFFLNTDADRAIALLGKSGFKYARQISIGLATRWNHSQPQITPTLSEQCDRCSDVVERLLKNKSFSAIDDPTRSALLKLTATIVQTDARVLHRHRNFTILLTLISSIELRVLLNRFEDGFSEPSGQESSKAIASICDCASLIDKCAVWFALNADSIDDEKSLTSLVSNFTSACESASQYFMRPSTDDKTLMKMDTLLACMLCSILTIFWVDDPVALSGLREAAARTRFKEAIVNIFMRVEKSAIQFLCPLLNKLPSEWYAKGLLQNNMQGLRRLLNCEIRTSLEEEIRPIRFVFATLVFASVSVDASFESMVEVRDVVLGLVNQAKAKRFKFDNKLESLCVKGCSLLLESHAATSESLSERARSFVDETNALTKNHLSIDGEFDVGELDFAMLGSGLSWKDLSRVSELVRLECVH